MFNIQSTCLVLEFNLILVLILTYDNNRYLEMAT